MIHNLRQREYKQTQSMHIYAYIIWYIHVDITHTHTGAIKACFMTLMNGLWILYPFSWDQKWGIAGCVEGHKHKHTYHLHIN